ncbi:hypothetical protein CDL15_Pgr003985 [Punica granatum]|nr:hypothetical protein CDL15_Pgr003985 [Punica granatum]
MLYKPLHFGHPLSVESSRVAAWSSKAAAFDGDLRRATPGVAETRPADVAVKASVAAAPEDVIMTDSWQDQAVGLVSHLMTGFAAGVLGLLKNAAKCRPGKLDVEMLVERAIINCRFFMWLAVAGTLLGSALCFVEGCFLVLESYVQYFCSMTQIMDQGHVIKLLIEALDMFLVGTSMLIFGVSLHVMFVGSKVKPGTGDRAWLPESNFFGLYNLWVLPCWVERQSVSQAKSKIGHAVMMLLQVGMLEKFKSIPVVTGLDLACFAGAVLLSSASIFLLSRLSIGRAAENQ